MASGSQKACQELRAVSCQENKIIHLCSAEEETEEEETSDGDYMD
jgi:hypothetical protein